MRWPKVRGGMVWISRSRLIKLQRRALRAYELERQIRGLRYVTALHVAQGHLAGMDGADRDAAAPIASAPPLMVDGSIDEPAFLAAVDAAVWQRRERELVTR